MTSHSRRRFRATGLALATLAVITAAAIQTQADPPPAKLPPPTTTPISQALLRKEKETHQALTQAWKQGQRELTRQHLVQLLDVRCQMYPVDNYPAGHPTLLNCLLDLSRVCRGLNRHQDLVEYGQRAREMADKLYPEIDFPYGHPQRAAAIMAQVLALTVSGRIAEAQNCCNEAMSAYHSLRKIEPSFVIDQRIADCQGIMGSLYEREGNYRSAELKFSMEYRLRGELQDGEMASLAACLSSNARVLRLLGRYDEALDFAEKALAVNQGLYRSDQFPDGHTLIVRAMRDVGLVHVRLGRHAAARKHLQDALAMDQRCCHVLGRPTGQRPGILNGLLLTALSESRLAEAEIYAQQLEAIIDATFSSEAFPGGHPAWAGFLTNIGAGYHISGDLETADDYYGRSLAMWNELDKTGRHPGLITVLDALGRLYLDRGQYARAHAYQSSALTLARDVFSPEEYPERARNIESLFTEYGGFVLVHGRDGKVRGGLRRSRYVERTAVSAGPISRRTPPVAAIVCGLGLRADERKQA